MFKRKTELLRLPLKGALDPRSPQKSVRRTGITNSSLAKPQRFASVSAFLEIAGPWCFLLLLGGIWIIFVLLSTETKMIELFQHQRSDVTLLELRIALEDLISNHPQASFFTDTTNKDAREAAVIYGENSKTQDNIQKLIDLAREKDPTARVIDLVSLDGTTQFSTALGTIGDSIELPSLNALQQYPHQKLDSPSDKQLCWTVIRSEEPMRATTLQNSSGKIIGYLLLAYESNFASENQFLLMLLCVIFAITLLIFTATFVFLKELNQKIKRQQDLAMKAALRDIAVTWNRFELCLKKIDESEKTE